MTPHTIRIPSRTLSTLGLGLALLVLSPKPASAADPLFALMATLVRGSLPDGPADELSPAERSELKALRPGQSEIRQMLDTAVVVARQTARGQAATSAYASQGSIPAAAGGYQTMQNTVNAAVTYWTGQPQQPAVAAQPAAAVSYGDPYGFTAWLNGVRAQYGLSAVSYDENLSAWANMNNAQQNSMGLGHHVMGPARRQNSAMGSSASIGSQWLASPAHADALLDPTIRAIGIAGMGAYWTFNAY